MATMVSSTSCLTVASAHHPRNTNRYVVAMHGKLRLVAEFPDRVSVAFALGDLAPPAVLRAVSRIFGSKNSRQKAVTGQLLQ